MKIWQKAAIAVAVVLVIGGIVWYSIYKSNQNVVTVQTGRVARQDLISLVTASGEIRPKNYTNVLGEGIGKITDIVVKEGDHVKKGDVLLHLENIQPGADVQAQVASIEAAESGMKAAAANYDSAVATAGAAPGRFRQGQLDWQRVPAALQGAAHLQAGLRLRPKPPTTARSRPSQRARRRWIRRAHPAIRRARISSKTTPC